VELVQTFTPEGKNRLRVTSVLHHRGPRAVTVNHVTLFATRQLGLGTAPADVRILEQNAYTGRVRTPRQMLTGSDRLKALDSTTGAFVSHNLVTFYCPTARAAVLLGFETVDRWLPQISGRMFATTGREASGMDNVDGAVTKAAAGAATPGGRVPPFREFTVEFDGGDYVLEPGHLARPRRLRPRVRRRPARAARRARPPAEDPQPLRRSHRPARQLVQLVSLPARRQRDQRPSPPRAPPAPTTSTSSGCVSSRWISAGRRTNIPSFFEENERFARGLGWLSTQLRAQQFDLGVWVGVLCIAENHPVAREHPEWLLRGADGKPRNNYNWFWEPFLPDLRARCLPPRRPAVAARELRPPRQEGRALREVGLRRRGHRQGTCAAGIIRSSSTPAPARPCAPPSASPTTPSSPPARRPS
jgi:hypothetical protein